MSSIHNDDETMKQIQNDERDECSDEPECEECSEECSEESECEELPDDLKAMIADVDDDVKRLTEKKTELQAKISGLEQQLTDINAAYPDFSPCLSETGYNKRKTSFMDADRAYKSALKKLNDDLMVVNKQIAAKKTEITKKLVVRGKPNPEDWNQYQVIRDLESEWLRIKNHHQIPPLPSKNDIEFFNRYPSYQTYISAAKTDFVSKTNPIRSELKCCTEMLKRVEVALLEDTWRPKYLIYAWKNDLDCDDENIFRVCNMHHMVELLDKWWFDCPCPANSPQYPSEDELEHGHSFCAGDNNRCTRGTKMHVSWKVDDLRLGFIEDTYPSTCSILLK